MKKHRFPVFRLLVSALLILILLYIMRDKYGDILRVLHNINLAIFITAFIIFLAAITVASVRLMLIIRAQEVSITFPESLSLTFIGYFFNNFLPTSIGGDAAKVYCLAKRTSDLASSFASVFTDRLIGLITMIFMAFVAIFFVGSRMGDETVKYLIYAITVISAFGIVFMTNERIARKFSIFFFFLKPIKEKLKKAYSAVNKYRYHKALMIQSLFISILSQLLFIVSITIVTLSIGSHLPFLDVLLRIPIVSALSLLPSINGLGVRESSTVVFFGPMIGKENAFAMSILWLFILFLVSIAGGIIYGLNPQFHVKLKELQEEEVLV